MGAKGEDNDIPYLSAPLIEVAQTVSDEDEEDLPTIEKLYKLVCEAEAEASNVNLIDLQHPKMTGTEQMHGMQFALDRLIIPFKTICESTIGDVRLKMREK